MKWRAKASAEIVNLLLGCFTAALLAVLGAPFWAAGAVGFIHMKLLDIEDRL